MVGKERRKFVLLRARGEYARLSATNHEQRDERTVAYGRLANRDQWSKVERILVGNR